MLSAERNVELPLLLTSLSAGERRKRAQAALSLVGLSDRRHHRPRELSGAGTTRRIARAIVSDPALLLCDEPTGDLDRKSGDKVLYLLQALNQQQGRTSIMVTCSEAMTMVRWASARGACSVCKRVNENPLPSASAGRLHVEILRTFFRPHNQRLWSVIGKEFDW